MPLEELRIERIRKLALLREKGIDPYPAETHRSHLVSELLAKFGALMRSKKKVIIAGRVMAKREHGGSAFLDIHDHTGKLQVYGKEDVLGGENYLLLIETVDIGDILEIEGTLFKTKREEETLEATAWRMLSKSLLPLPEKWHGLQDVEERFRKRYLDLLMNEEVRVRFILRSAIIKAIRSFFDKEGFMEVETPFLHPIVGGALAKPFVTHQNALDVDLYLRVAPELYLKRLLVGGFEKIYELGKNFRNEGIDAEHNPEFTSIEWYAAYWDEERMMECTEYAMRYILKHSCVNDPFSFNGKEISFAKSFVRMEFKEVLQRYALISDFPRETSESLATRARQLGIEVSPHESKGKIADEIYKKICRAYLVQPTFILHHPLDISPLAKCASNPDEVRRFQLVAGGLEIVNAFAELNDPLDQRERFIEQEHTREKGDREAHPFDGDFVEALEYGMPPAAGAAIGIDRLVMLLTDAKNIKEVLLFPTMRPKA